MKVHNALTRGDLSAALKVSLGDTKSEGGVERYGETLEPVVDLWSRPEWSRLRGEHLFGSLTGQGAVVAEFGVVALLNPVLSGMIVVVTGAMVNAAPLQCLLTYLEDSGATFAGIATVARGTSRDWPRDTTIAAVVESRAQIRTGTELVILGRILDRRVTSAAEPVRDFQQGLPAVLRPGKALAIWGETVNTGVTGSFTWSERQAFPGELI